MPIKKKYFLIALVLIVVQLEAQKLYYFSGSDWCAPCVRLKKEVIDNEGFVTGIEALGVVIEVVDFPQRKKGISRVELSYRDSLAKVLNPQGKFPLLVYYESDSNYFVVNHQGNVQHVLSQLPLNHKIETSKSIRKNLMGSFFEIKLLGKDTVYLDSTLNYASRVVQLISSWDSTSFTSIINRNAGVKPTTVSKLYRDFILSNQVLAKITNGGFDPTIKPLLDIWYWKHKTVPSDSLIQEKSKLVGYDKIEVDTFSNTIFLREKGMGLDFGGCGKGYLADKIVEFWKSLGVKNGVVNAGGDIRLLGDNNGFNWPVVIRDPFQKQSFVYQGEFADLAVVTSGTYERYFEDSTNLYSHFIHPKNGKPIQNDLVSVTVFASSAFLADAFATAVFVLGKEEGIKLLEKYGLKGILITKNKAVLKTNGLKEY